MGPRVRRVTLYRIVALTVVKANSQQVCVRGVLKFKWLARWMKMGEMKLEKIVLQK